MNTQITVVAGFLESGKTSFINRLLADEQYSDGRSTVLICCEEGLEEYDAKLLRNKHITVVTVEDEHALDEALFARIDEEYYPDRILIEYNGTWKLGTLLGLRLPRGVGIVHVLGLADASTFAVYMSNMSRLMAEQFANCDAVLINRYEELDQEHTGAIRRSLKNLNKGVRVAFYDGLPPENILRNVLREQTPARRAAKVAGVFVPLCVLYMLILFLRGSQMQAQFAQLHTFITVFLSILIQAIPFLLIGVLVSSMLQVFVPDAYLAGLFSRARWLGYPVAVLIGMCFPVCDCAMAPVAARLIRKGAPLSCAVTFLLAAPAVNPVVILSTYYAFPDRPQVIVLRVLFGIFVAVVSGFAMGRLFQGTSPMQKTFLESSCASGYIGDLSDEGVRGKLGAVFRHAGMEFFNIGRFVVAGAFISSLLQMAIPKSALAALAQNLFVSLVVMLAASFLMSICASSNAFIARSFSYSFPMHAVLAFMVMGPLLDIKNLLMLAGGFRHKFVGVLVVFLLSMALFTFSLASMWI